MILCKSSLRISLVIFLNGSLSRGEKVGKQPEKENIFKSQTTPQMLQSHPINLAWGSQRRTKWQSIKYMSNYRQMLHFVRRQQEVSNGVVTTLKCWIGTLYTLKTTCDLAFCSLSLVLKTEVLQKFQIKQEYKAWWCCHWWVPAPRGSLAHLKPHHCTFCCRTLDQLFTSFFLCCETAQIFLKKLLFKKKPTKLPLAAEGL